MGVMASIVQILELFDKVGGDKQVKQSIYLKHFHTLQGHEQHSKTHNYLQADNVAQYPCIHLKVKTNVVHVNCWYT